MDDAVNAFQPVPMVLRVLFPGAGQSALHVQRAFIVVFQLDIQHIALIQNGQADDFLLGVFNAFYAFDGVVQGVAQQGI